MKTGHDKHMILKNRGYDKHMLIHNRDLRKDLLDKIETARASLDRGPSFIEYPGLVPTPQEWNDYWLSKLNLFFGIWANTLQTTQTIGDTR